VIWHKHYLKNFFIIGSIVVGIISVTNFLLLKLYGIFSQYPFVLLLYFVVGEIELRRNLRRFKREWQKTHPCDTAGESVKIAPRITGVSRISRAAESDPLKILNHACLFPQSALFAANFCDVSRRIRTKNV
jgi:hypothetical protein